MNYVDEINVKFGGEGTKMYSTSGTHIKKLCMQNKLNLLDASVRHLGTDINYVVLENLYAKLKDTVEFRFNCHVDDVETIDGGYRVITKDGVDECKKCIVSVGRSGSKWMVWTGTAVFPAPTAAICPDGAFFAWATGSSTNVFHSLHTGHCPSHFADS